MIFRSIMFWNACILFKLDFFADPHSWIPYVGRDLHINNLVFTVEKLFFENNIFKDQERALSNSLLI